ncbi:MAG: hypothetical protein AABZ33_06630 [Chloroflexota bacterium]
MNTDRMSRVRHRHVSWLLGFALVLAACAAPASPSPVEPSDAAPESSAPAGADPTASPTASPTATPNPTCPPVDYAGFVASERLTNVSVAPGTAGDLVGFILVPSPGSPLRPRLTVSSVEPPFSEGASGLPLEVAGEHHILVRFEGMLHVDDAGVLVYVGPRDQPGIGGPVRQVLLTEAFESYVSFIVGYDGDGCVALSVQPTLITIAIAAP